MHLCLTVSNRIIIIIKELPSSFYLDLKSHYCLVPLDTTIQTKTVQRGREKRDLNFLTL